MKLETRFKHFRNSDPDWSTIVGKVWGEAMLNRQIKPDQSFMDKEGYVGFNGAIERLAPYMYNYFNAVTVCTIYCGAKKHQGYAFCSINDNFCKKTGRIIAQNRAIKELDFLPRKDNSEERI